MYSLADQVGMIFSSRRAPFVYFWSPSSNVHTQSHAFDEPRVRRLHFDSPNRLSFAFSRLVLPRPPLIAPRATRISYLGSVSPPPFAKSGLPNLHAPQISASTRDLQGPEQKKSLRHPPAGGRALAPRSGGGCRVGSWQPSPIWALGWTRAQFVHSDSLWPSSASLEDFEQLLS